MKTIPTFKRVFFLWFFLVLIFFSLSPFAPEAGSEDEIVLIGNPDVPVASLTKVEVNHIFLGKKTEWDNGQAIKFVTLKKSDSHSQFLRMFIKKTPDQFKAYWNRMLFTGKGMVPQSFATDEALEEFVSQNSGYIGYVSGSAIKENVKVIPLTD